MILGAHDALGSSLERALLITKDEHTSPEVYRLAQVEIIESAHPIPDQRSLAAGARLLEWVDSVPADERPPVNVVRFAFQAMVGIGSALALLGAGFVAFWFKRRRLPSSRWFLGALVAAGPLSVVALLAGWVTTEVGRQPWIVYDVMRTEEAVTGAGGIPVGYAAIAVVYAGLLIALTWLLRRLGRAPLELSEPVESPVTGD